MHIYMCVNSINMVNMYYGNMSVHIIYNTIIHDKYINHCYYSLVSYLSKHLQTLAWRHMKHSMNMHEDSDINES